jgi:hypothetical protein
LPVKRLPKPKPKPKQKPKAKAPKAKKTNTRANAVRQRKNALARERRALARIEAIRAAERKEAQRLRRNELARKRYAVRKEKALILRKWEEAIREDLAYRAERVGWRTASFVQDVPTDAVMRSAKARGLRNLEYTSDGDWIAFTQAGTKMLLYMPINVDNGLVRLLWSRYDTIKHFSPKSFGDKYLSHSRKVEVIF